jgi:hypothetical protein
MRDEAKVEVTVNGARRAGSISRREAMAWVMGAVAASALPGLAQEVGRTVTPQENASRVAGAPGGAGYGMDVDLLKVRTPGEFWPLTFDAGQKRTATALADLIIPRDGLGPAASEVGVVEMVDEWVSAPYPAQQADRPVVLEGLAWIEGEAKGRFRKSFGDLPAEQMRAIADDVCDSARAEARFKKGAAFFSRFRSLCAGAYYATPAGWSAIGYVGNVALPSFEGPPAEVLRRLGVEQTVR